MDNEDGGLSFRADNSNFDTPDDASCNSESLTARLEQLLCCLPANSDPAQRLRQLLDDLNRDAQKHKPHDKIQPCVPEESTSQMWLRKMGMGKKKPKKTYKAADYHLQHYDDAYNVDVQNQMTQGEIEKQQAHLAGRKASLQRRYDQREPADYFDQDNPEDLVVRRVLEGYDRREQEMAWRQPDSSFRDEIETAAVLEVELMPFYTDAYSKKLRLSKPEARAHLVHLTNRMAQLDQVKDDALNLQQGKDRLLAALYIRLMELDWLIPESQVHQHYSEPGRSPYRPY